MTTKQIFKQFTQMTEKDRNSFIQMIVNSNTGVVSETLVNSLSYDGLTELRKVNNDAIKYHSDRPETVVSPITTAKNELKKDILNTVCEKNKIVQILRKFCLPDKEGNIRHNPINFLNDRLREKFNPDNFKTLLGKKILDFYFDELITVSSSARLKTIQENWNNNILLVKDAIFIVSNFASMPDRTFKGVQNSFKESLETKPTKRNRKTSSSLVSETLSATDVKSAK